MKRMIALCASILVCAGALTACASGGGSNSYTASSQETTAETTTIVAEEAVSETGTTETATEKIKVDKNAIPDGTYIATAMTNHFASSCLAGIDFDSLFDVNFTVVNGLFKDITLDIGKNAKSVPETAEISMEDWPFVKLAELQACQSLLGKAATKESVLEAWQIENREDLYESGIDAVSGATESSRAVRDAIIGTITMIDGGYKYDTEFHAKDAVPTLVMFTGNVISEETMENGRVSKTTQIDDGDYVLYGVVSANNNEIDNTAVDYDYIVKVEISVDDGKVKEINCTTPNGSAESKKAVAEANTLTKTALEGKDATNTEITNNLPYNSRSEEPFGGSVGAQIACDMIGNCLRNGCTHTVGWTYN